MGVQSPDETAYVGKMSSDKKYFTYGRHPKNIPLEVYLKIYEAFCDAYKIPVVDSDVRQFTFLLNKRIFRYNPDGMDYRPMNKDARLLVTPHGGCVFFHSFSYNNTSNQNFKFMELADKYLKSLKKSKTIDDKVQ